MRKELELDERFPKTGEATVQLVAFAGMRGNLVIEKRAFAESRSPLYDFLSTVQPESGATFLLVNALGSWEAYDDNKNGDGFPERPYKVGTRASCGHPDCTKTLDGWIAEHEVLTKHYGSFEEFGGIYTHHRNKDKTKSLGDIKKAVWNPRMHRVELLLKVYNAKAGDLVQRVSSDDLPAVSMGTHVRWDVCTVCGHRAPTRAQYCKHAMTQLRDILPGGLKVAVLNPSPRFFDISFVFRPADPTGWTLQKVARASVTPSALIGDYRTAAEREAERFSKIATEMHAAWYDPQSLIGQYVQSVDLNPPTHRAWPQAEVYKFAAEAFQLPISDEGVERLVALTPALVSLLGQYPETFKAASSEVQNVLRERAYAPSENFDSLPYGPGARYRAAEPPRTDLLTMTDPYTGHVYQTTRGAAMEAAKGDATTKLRNTALFGALYAAGLHVGLGGRLGAWALPVGGALGAATHRFLQTSPAAYRNPSYMTDQGIPLSGGTEFKQASHDDWALKLAYDRAALPNQGAYTSLTRNPIENITSVLTYGCEVPSSTAYETPTLDLNTFGRNLAYVLSL